MAIYRPGVKFRHSRILARREAGRELVAVLSLTAMVDMFTVLVIFLLQNYNSTGEVLYIPKEVVLPKASTVKELKPSHVVTISGTHILVGKEIIANFEDVKEQKDWMIRPLYNRLIQDLKEAKLKKQAGVGNQFQQAVRESRLEKPEDPNNWRKVTVQADREIDFLSVKKVMFTVTEAGAAEINFAVLKRKANGEE